VVFFDDKIQKAKEAIKTRLSSDGTQPLQFDAAFAGSPLDDLQLPTEDEVRRLNQHNAQQSRHLLTAYHTDVHHQVVF